METRNTARVLFPEKLRMRCVDTTLKHAAVCWSGLNRIPQTRELKQKLIFPQFWTEAGSPRSQGVGTCGFYLGSLLGLQTAPSSGVLTRPWACIHVLISSSYKNTNHIGFEPALIIAFTLITSLENLSTNTVIF